MTDAQIAKKLQRIHDGIYQGTPSQVQDLVEMGLVYISSSGKISITCDGMQFKDDYYIAKSNPHSYQAQERRAQKKAQLQSQGGGKKKKYSSPYEEAYHLAQEDRVGFFIGAALGFAERFLG